MKNVIIFFLLAMTIALGWELWDARKQLHSTVELTVRTQTLTLALLRYHNGKINIDSLLAVVSYYEDYSVTVPLEER